MRRASHRRAATSTFEKARELRHNLTEAEAALWQALRMHRLEDIHFRRQQAVGPYVVDFCAPRIKLIIEVDGGQHKDQLEYDTERTDFLRSKGYMVLRFWNDEVLNHIDKVLHEIARAIGEKKQPPKET